MRKFKESDYVVLSATLISFIVAFISSAPAVALPSMAKEFLLTNIDQNWVINTFLFTVVILTIPFGKFSGKFGIKKTFNLGMILFLIGSIITIFSFSKESLFIFRAFQGIGAALVYDTVTSIVTMAVPKKHRGAALGIVITGVYIGLAIAPFIGGILTYNIGWRGIFYFSIPIIIAILVISFLKLKKDWFPYKKDTFDKIGSLIYAIGIALFIYGFSILNEANGVIITILGIILLIIFVVYELKVKIPVFNMRLFKNKKFALSNLASIISYIATFVVTYILNYHFQYIMGLDAQLSGTILVVTPIVMAIVAPFSGTLSDKINPQKLAAIGMGLVTIALAILSFLNATTPLYVIIIAQFLQGLGYGLFSSPNTNIIMSSVPVKETPSASVSLTFMRVVGQSISLAMLTIIFAIIMGQVAIVPANYGLLTISCQITCIISTILCIIAIIASLVGMTTKKEEFY